MGLLLRIDYHQYQYGTYLSQRGKIFGVDLEMRCESDEFWHASFSTSFGW